ncbi:DNA cytosine methyltransferase [Microcoleus sp. MON2_D5]|uniref:DNA cytosine methyltransferase n=1 Tax=Microcoleus sp. MON2_D5 TaxID=2818833 RepID=UPI002FD52647
MKLRAATLCSGIGAPEHALTDRYDFKFCAEIEKFPSAVLAYHYPETPNLGDITKIDGTLWRDEIDIVIGGPPCQSFSVAGDRQSLDDPRGMLTFQYLELLNQIQPAIAIYENVPGILSAAGNPWGKFLGCTVGSDEILPPGGRWRRAGMVAGKYISVAWRTLNARNFGLAQNRERVYAVIVDSRKFGRLVGAKPWFESRRFLSVSGEISFEFGGSVGSVASQQSAREKIAPDFTARIEFPPPISDTLGQGHGGGGNRIDGVGCYIPIAVGFSSIDYRNGAQSELSPTLRSGKCGNSSAVAFPAVGFSKVDAGGDAREECAPTLRAGNFHKSHISSTASGASIAYSIDCRQATLRQETSNALLAKGSGGWSLDQVSSVVSRQSLGWEIRRLTPIECERLQGFPDDYTNIPWRNKSYSPNSLRYKALGNSMAVPCLRYIADCLDMVLQRYQTFFDQPDALDVYLTGLQVEAKEQMARDRFKATEGIQLSLF